VQLEVIGFTDRTGPRPVNDPLGLARAQAVKATLTRFGRGGIDERFITTNSVRQVREKLVHKISSALGSPGVFTRPTAADLNPIADFAMTPENRIHVRRPPNPRPDRIRRHIRC